MNTRASLNEIKSLLDKANALLQTIIEAQPKPTDMKGRTSMRTKVMVAAQTATAMACGLRTKTGSVLNGS